MRTLKVVVSFYILTFALLLISNQSNARRVRLTSNKRKLTSYIKYIKQVFSGKSLKRRPRHLNFKNNTPSGKIKAQLYCRTGFLLEVLGNGKVGGTQNVSSQYTIIEIEIFGDVTRRLKGVASGRYLSLNNRGRLSSTQRFHQNKNVFFKENHEENYWFTYSSSHHSRNCSWKRDTARLKEWFIAIKKNGSLKQPCKTQPGMRSTQFIILPQKTKGIWVNDKTIPNKG